MKRTIALLCSLVVLLPGVASAQRVLGDFILGQTVVCPWSTFDKNGNSATPGTAGTLYVSKDGDTATEKSVVANLSGTDARGLDSDAGRHRAIVPTTDAYFTADSTYEIIARGTVVDSQTFSVSVCFFSIEHLYPLKGAIKLHATEDSGQTSTVNQIELTGDVITSTDQYKAYRLWDVTDGWDRAIVGSNAASDYLTIYPDAPAAPTNGAVLYIMRDVIYPVNFFDPATQEVNVGQVKGTALTAQAGVNFNDVFNNGGSASGTNARIGSLGTNATNAAAASLAVQNAIVLASGAADSGTLVTMVDNALTQADTNYWGHDVGIVFVSGNLAGQAACVTGFDPSMDKITFSPPVSQTVTTQQYVLIPAPSCDPFR